MGFLENWVKHLEEKMIAAGYGGDGETEVNVVTLKGVEYFESGRISLDGNTYVFLSAEESDAFCIKKLVVKEDGDQYIIGLDSKEEFDRALAAFANSLLNEVDPERELR